MGLATSLLGPPPTVRHPRVAQVFARPTFAKTLHAPPPPAPRPRHHWGWISFAVVALLFIGAVARFYFHDEPPPVDSDLAVPRTTVAPENNGLVQLARLPEKSLDFDAFAAARGITGADADAILFGNVRNDAVVDAYLAQVQPAFTQLDSILALPHFVNPGGVYPLPKFPELVPALSLAKALRLAAQRSLELKDFNSAVQDTLRLRSLATRLTENYPFLIQYLTAHTIYDYSAACARDLLNTPSLPLGQQIVITAAYSGQAPTNAAFQRALAVEYQYLVAELNAEDKRGALSDAESSGGGPLHFLDAFWLHLTVKPNATRHRLAEFFRAWRTSLDGPYSAIDPHALDGARLRPSADEGAFAKVIDYSAPNSGGRYFYRLAHPSPDLLKLPYLEVADDRLLRTGFALRRFWNDNGYLPATLGDLVPKYIETIPSYPYDEQPLHYNQVKGLVYSLGTTLKDVGGSRFARQPTSTPGYIDPLLDPAQPTLVLTFQNQK